MNLRLLSACLALILTLTGCQTTSMQGIQSSRMAMTDAIRSEEPGNYYIGRRYYKQDYKFWGFIRRPGQPWNTAKLVMLNEHTKLAPDRELGKIGSDNNYEYKVYGDFSGETVYEPASNGFYPEFVLKAYELRSVSPVNIFRTAGATDPARRVIGQPF
ncbi:MAG TPA: hypothetical protein VF614_15945 [Chthoniobacteraceae bacterium]|jgi:hypothetical protein